VSETNVEVVQAAIDAYNAGDIDTMLRLYAVDSQVIPDGGMPESERLHGRESIRDWINELGGAWSRVRWETEEVRAVGAERVLVRGAWGGTGQGSGLDIASNFSGIFTVRYGDITKVEYFQDHAQALKAAGVEG
jgi:ketosteroid isomerase-like protein